MTFAAFESVRPFGRFAAAKKMGRGHDMHAGIQKRRHRRRRRRRKPTRKDLEGSFTYDVCTGRGESGVPQKQTTVLISCVSATVTREEGRRGQKSENLADVICTCPQEGQPPQDGSSQLWLRWRGFRFWISSDLDLGIRTGMGQRMVPRLCDSRILASSCCGTRFTQPRIHSLAYACILYTL